MIIVHDILKWDDVWSNFIRHKTHALWSSSSELISLGTFKINRILGFIRTTGENLMMLIVLRLENKSIYSNPSGKASSNSHYKRRICLLCMLMGQVIFFFTSNLNEMHILPFPLCLQFLPRMFFKRLQWWFSPNSHFPLNTWQLLAYFRSYPCSIIIIFLAVVHTCFLSQ